MTKVRTAFVLDNLGTFGETPDEERDNIIKELREEGIEPNVVFYGHSPTELPDTSIELLVVDYGALWQQGMQDWTRHLLRWADDHPGSLVVVWTSMTVDLFVSELAPFNDGTGWYDKAELPSNLVALHPGAISRPGIDWRQYGDSIDWLDQSWQKIRSWFGATPPERDYTLAPPS